ncbi:hypothetical protein BC835DRAFT_309214 [Cytidiella melzeri]|nr:hypothetical protein BC835DRAFT_309214 [Cytidiella melzeri]
MSADSLRDEAGEGEDVGGLVVDSDNSWKVLLHEVDWTYRRRYLWTETGERLPAHPRPPYYCDFLACEEDCPAELGCPLFDEDVELSDSLVGVQGAEDIVTRYELAVGIAYELDSSLAIFYPTHHPLFLGELSEDESARVHSQWGELVDRLLGGIFAPGDFTVALDPEYGVNFLTVDSASLSDTSLDSDSDPLPTTPDADKKLYAEALFDERARGDVQDGSVFSPSPSKPKLNASALSFVPAYNSEGGSPPPFSSDSPYVSPTYEFHFPSLNNQSANRNKSRSVPPPLRRDEHGFYTEVSAQAATRSSMPRRTPGRMVSELLADSPSPTRSMRQSSKTRELVDRLRSSAPSRRLRKNKGEASSLHHLMSSMHCGDNDAAAAVDKDVDDEDGWIMGGIMGVEGAEKVSGSVGQEDWVQGLFQCRSPSQLHSKKQSKHERSSSTSTVYTTSNTPSSASSQFSTLPSPATSMSCARAPPKPPVFTGQFPAVPPYVAFPGPYAAYPGLMPPAMVPASAMMPLPQSWGMPMPPVLAPAVYPNVMPVYVHRG